MVSSAALAACGIAVFFLLGSITVAVLLIGGGVAGSVLALLLADRRK